MSVDLIDGGRLESVDMDILEAFRCILEIKQRASSRLPEQTRFLIGKTLGKLDTLGDAKAAILGLIFRVQHKVQIDLLHMWC